MGTTEKLQSSEETTPKHVQGVFFWVFDPAFKKRVICKKQGRRLISLYDGKVLLRENKDGTYYVPKTKEE